MTKKQRTIALKIFAIIAIAAIVVSGLSSTLMF
jgi:hypothetical protein